MKIWRLKSGADRRIRSGHPWVFSNELSESPKGSEPGEPIILQDSKGHFVASGYGNPNSLISFRALSFDSQVQNPTEENFIREKILKAWKQRKSLGFNQSFRLCYGEGDFLSGLVIDRYSVEKNQVLAVQVLSAGMNRALKNIEDFFSQMIADAYHQGLCSQKWAETAIVLRNDVPVRKLEGLNYEDSRLIKGLDGVNLKKAEITLQNGLLMTVDLLEGQKTGFFLDQAYNIQILCDQIKKSKSHWQGPVKILDLCCYVGQWSAQIAKIFQELGVQCEATLVDVSKEALALAKVNVERQGAKAIMLELDVVQDLPKLADRSYDIVIADPPAFIKAKKDIPTGKHAYLKLNTQAFRLAKSGGLVASCSCSGLFEESELVDVIRKSIQRDGRECRCISQGGHSADHPVLMAFNEGFYLKMFLHSVQ